MNTAPKPMDHLKRNFLSILALGLGLVLGYGFGASRSNYAIVYAPAPNVPGIVGANALPASSPAAQVAATASGSEPSLRPSGQALAAGGAKPVAPASAARVETAASEPARKPAESRLAAAPAPADMTAHEKTAAFLSKTQDAKTAKAVAQAAPAPEPVVKPVDNAPQQHVVAAEIGAIHYGAATRGEIMGRGAGPVYNFSGGTGAKAGSAGGAAGGATPDNATKVEASQNPSPAGSVGANLDAAASVFDAAQQQLEKAPLSPEMRQQLTTSLKASKSSVNAVAAGQPGQ